MVVRPVGRTVLLCAAAWRSRCDGRRFYARRLKDSRLADIGTRLTAALPFYARLCGPHIGACARVSSGWAMVAGYVGQGEAFDTAIGTFADASTDQTERDRHPFLATIKSGRIAAGEA